MKKKTTKKRTRKPAPKPAGKPKPAAKKKAPKGGTAPRLAAPGNWPATEPDRLVMRQVAVLSALQRRKALGAHGLDIPALCESAYRALSVKLPPRDMWAVVERLRKLGLIELHRPAHTWMSASSTYTLTQAGAEAWGKWQTAALAMVKESKPDAAPQPAPTDPARPASPKRAPKRKPEAGPKQKPRRGRAATPRRKPVRRPAK